jgi:hypothetical protein
MTETNKFARALTDAHMHELLRVTLGFFLDRKGHMTRLYLKNKFCTGVASLHEAVSTTLQAIR